MTREDRIIQLVSSGELSIDSDGRIWRHRIRRGGNIISCTPRRAEHRTGLGYLQVRAMIDGKRLHVGAHRVVWRWFNGVIPNDHEINHLNGQKDDNRPGNLAIAGRAENRRHATTAGLIDQSGEKNPAHRLTDNEIAQIRLAYSSGGYTQAELAKKYGVTHQTVSKVVRGDRRARQLGKVDPTDHRRAGEHRGSDGRFAPNPADLRVWQMPEVDHA